VSCSQGEKEDDAGPSTTAHWCGLTSKKQPSVGFSGCRLLGALATWVVPLTFDNNVDVASDYSPLISLLRFLDNILLDDDLIMMMRWETNISAL